MLIELGGQIALCIMEALMVTVHEQGMKISGVTVSCCIHVYSHCPSRTGMLSTSVKLVSLRKWFSSFYLGKKKQYYHGIRALLHHLVGRLNFLRQ